MAVFLYNNDIFTSRMPKERLEKALKQREMISDEDYAKVIGLANIVRPVCSFLFKTPDVYGMTYEERFIPSIDGVPIEMWYIPVKGAPSDKLVIFNPALPMCRAGFPGHFGEPFSSFDEVEIDFVIQYKHLTDAGYNVLTYDIRNYGLSGEANGGISGIGNYEWRDCVAVKEYVDRDPTLSKMKVARYSQCMGVNSQYHAIYRRPELFENVRCMVSPMVVSMAAIFDLVSSKEKELHWIENTPYRFKDGYNYFGREPEKVLAFLDAHMN